MGDAVSYTFEVTKTDEGLTAETGHLDSIPNGVFSVSGHEDVSYRSIAVTRQNPESSFVQVQATGQGARQ